MKQILGLQIIAALALSCKKNDTNVVKTALIYVETNNFLDNQNAGLVYRDSKNGKACAIAGKSLSLICTAYTDLFKIILLNLLVLQKSYLCLLIEYRLT